MTNGLNRTGKRMVGALVAIGVGLGVTLQAQGGGKNSDIPVTSTVATSQNGVALRVEGDMKGVYTNTPQVTSVILGSNHDWILQTYYWSKHKLTASDRSVFFDFTEPVAPTNPLPPFTAAYAQAFLNVRCSAANIDMLAIGSGATVQCPGHFKFIAPGGLQYRIAFNKVNFPDVQPLNVTCTLSDSRGCRSWSVAPSGTTITGTDPNPKNIGKLLQIDSNDNILANLGNYYVSFAITFAR